MKGYDTEMKPKTISYDSDTCEIKYNGITIGTWNDEAHYDYPEDLTWDRDIGDLVCTIFDSGMLQGKAELESKLAKAKEALEFYAGNSNWYLLENTHSIITDEDLDDSNANACLGIKLMGGRRAREALKEIE